MTIGEGVYGLADENFQYVVVLGFVLKQAKLFVMTKFIKHHFSIHIFDTFS